MNHLKKYNEDKWAKHDHFSVVFEDPLDRDITNSMPNLSYLIRWLHGEQFIESMKKYDNKIDFKKGRFIGDNVFIEDCFSEDCGKKWKVSEYYLKSDLELGVVDAFDNSDVLKFIYLLDKRVSLDKLISYRMYQNLYSSNFFKTEVIQKYLINNNLEFFKLLMNNDLDINPNILKDPDCKQIIDSISMGLL